MVVLFVDDLVMNVLGVKLSLFIAEPSLQLTEFLHKRLHLRHDKSNNRFSPFHFILWKTFDTQQSTQLHVSLMEIFDLSNFLLQLDLESYFNIIGHALQDIERSSVLHILRKFLFVVPKLRFQPQLLFTLLVQTITQNLFFSFQQTVLLFKFVDVLKLDFEAVVASDAGGLSSIALQLVSEF